MKTRTAIQAVVLLILFACPLAAAEFQPVSVWTDAEWYPNPPGRYAPGKMIDGDLGTYACLLDDTRTGKDVRVFPHELAIKRVALNHAAIFERLVRLALDVADAPDKAAELL